MGRYLVCYFSPTGTTKAVADQIATAIKADRLEIKAKKPYSDEDLNWNKFFSRCRREHRRKALPEVGYHMFNLSQYGVVFLGFPIWFETAPRIIMSFLKSNDWKGQRIVLFATSGGSGIQQAKEDIQRFLNDKGEIPAADILDLSSPEKVGGWAADTLRFIVKDVRSEAEEYLDEHYVEPAPFVQEEQAVYEPETDSLGKESERGDVPKNREYHSEVKFSVALPSSNNSDRPSVAGGKFSRDIEPKESELERLRRENKRLLQIINSNRGKDEVVRSPLDRYNSGAIERVMRSAPSKATSGTPTRASVLDSLESYMDQSFVGKLVALIREKGLKESDVYRAAQIDRKLFSKIISDQEYKPAKDTCISLAYALQLSLEETNDLLSRAGYTLSHSNKRDVILEYFFSTHNHDLFEINEVLLQLNQKPLGRQS